MSTTNGRRANGDGSIDRFHRPPCAGAGDDCACRYRARASVTVNGKRERRAVYGKTQAEVRAKLRKLEADDTNGTLVPVTGTVGQWLDDWYETTKREWKPNTRNCYRSKIDCYLKPHLGNVRLDRLAPDHLDKMYRAMREQGLGEKTLRQAHAILRRALHVANVYGKVSRNVADLVVSKPKVEKSTPKCMGLDDARRVLAAAGANPRFHISLLGGLRQGECLALRWCDIYWSGTMLLSGQTVEGPYLIVRRSLSRIPGEGLVFTTPKSAASKDRIVPLFPETVELLRAHRQRLIAKGGGAADDLVFPNSVGNPQESRRDHDHWQALLVAAGVERHTLHSARNTCAHLLEDAGVAPRVVAEILGHSAVDMTYHYQSGNVPAVHSAIGSLRELVIGSSERKEIAS